MFARLSNIKNVQPRKENYHPNREKSMKYLFLIIYISLVVFLCTSCNTTQKKKIVFDSITDDVEFDDSTTCQLASSDYIQMNGDIISIPFIEQGGVKFLDVTINGIGLQMIFDTGCSGALISVAEARYLYEKGRITDADIKGITQAQIADGSIVENMVINLKEVVVGGKVLCPDVEVTVSPNTNAPLLLGGEIINRFAAYSVDNNNKVINFKIK